MPEASVLARPPMILTASRIISVDILSSMMMSALASRASLTSSKLVASTSICMPGATLERTCSTALAIEPAILIWLSFIMAMSYRPMRWFTAPPSCTAILSVTLMPGAVLRVSSRRVCVPRSSATYLAVSVAIPDILWKKLSAVLSAFRSAG